jgi:C-terminal processing protease CtpA/Prc
MGNAASAAGEGADVPHGDEDHCGYRVLGVQAGSPAASAGLVSFFDFIVMANHIPLRRVDNTFVDLIREFEDRPLALQIYNSKSQTLRDVTLTPSKRWPGQGMLGVTIRFDFYDHAEEHLVRVLEVVPNSPAELAGLQPMTDYLLGTAETVFKGEYVD